MTDITGCHEGWLTHANTLLMVTDWKQLPWSSLSYACGSYGVAQEGYLFWRVRESAWLSDPLRATLCGFASEWILHCHNCVTTGSYYVTYSTLRFMCVFWKDAFTVSSYIWMILALLFSSLCHRKGMALRKGWPVKVQTLITVKCARPFSDVLLTNRFVSCRVW